MNILLIGQQSMDFLLCLSHLILVGIPMISDFYGWRNIVTQDFRLIQFIGFAYWGGETKHFILNYPRNLVFFVVKISSHYFVVAISVLR